MFFERVMKLGMVSLLVLPAGTVAVAQATSAAPAQVQTPAAPAVAASSAGTRVHGTITDPDGELIPGATVTLTPAKGTAIAVTSGSDGSYALTVKPGTYTMVVSMPGFASYLTTGLKIPPVGSMTLDEKLQVGTENQVINVEANAIQLSVDPDSNASSSIISGKDLEALSDDPDELQSELTALAGPSAGPNGGQIYVDGFTGGQLPPKSSIREIRINQNPFSAEYDKLGYGRIEVFTKPGTDKLHGNFQINGNPSQFNTANPLNTTTQPPYHTIFTFGNVTGPLASWASYNLAGTYRGIQDDEFTDATISALPGSTTLCAPGQTGCVSTPYQFSTYYPQTRAEINPRVDLALGEKNVLVTRYQYVNNKSTDTGVGNLTLPTAATDTSSLSNILQVSDTQTISSRLINETHFEYEREHETTTALNNTPTIGVSGSFTGGGSSGQNLSDHSDHFEIQNYTSLQLKKNFVRMGGRVRIEREAMDTEAGTNGSFNYASLVYTCNGTYLAGGVVTPCATSTSGQGTAADNSYLTGTPRQFGYTVVNNHKIGDTLTDLGLYAESDWKPRPNLTVSYGLRYETQSHLSDHHDFAPRVSFNYGLFSGKGSPKTVLRGGFGVFYDRFGQGNVLTLEQENGINETIYTVNNISPSAGCAPTLTTPLTQQIVTNCKGSTPASAQTRYSAANGLRAPYVIQEAIGADQQIGRFGTISVNYLHSQGAHQLATQNIGYNFTTPASSLPQYQYFTEGVFKQNQLIVNGRVQTSKRISLFGYYSLNSAQGDSSGAGSFISTPGNIAADYGRTSFAVKQRLFMAGSISLPKFIQFSPFMIAQSGRPYNITTGTDNNGDTVFNDRALLANGATPNGSTVKTIPGCGTFAQPNSGVAGTTVPINYCTGPSEFTLNFRLTKTFGFGKSTAPPANPNGGHGSSGSPLGGGPGSSGSHSHSGGGHSSSGGMFGGGGSSTGKRFNLTFGVQFQNVFNNKDLSTPQGTLSSPNFGTSTQLAGEPFTTNAATRRIQLQTSFSF